MRVILTVSMLCIILLSASGQEKLYALNAPSEQLKVSGNIHVTFHPSDSTYLEYETEEMPDNLIIEQDKSKLTLKTKTELSQSEAIKVILYHTPLKGLEVVRGAVVQSAGTLHYQVLTLKTDSGGKVELTLSLDSLSARVNQGSDMILYGSARSIQVNANTVGNFLAYKLEAKNAWVKAATGAQVKVHTTQYLNANATGTAFIGYMGKPEDREIKASLGGKVTQESE
jgi:hypothetical protein